MLQPRRRSPSDFGLETLDDLRRPPLEHLDPVRSVLVAGYLALAVYYLAWRAGTLNPGALVFSGLIYGVELFGFAATVLYLFMVWSLTVRKAPAPPADATVDVFVASRNEPVETLRRTLLAARGLDFPHQTWLLEDGNRAEMAALAAELGIRHLGRGENAHAEAGNLNHALSRSRAEFIAVFDADHAPKRSFLHATLGYFRDPEVALVQTPQDFFNLDPHRHCRRRRGGPAWGEQSLFFRVIQRGRDRWNAALFCGSCAVIRRGALERIGGFRTHHGTGDLETSLALHRAGYRSVYVAEPLAFGIAPTAAGPVPERHVRWDPGAMRMMRREGFFLRGRLSLAQRLGYMASVLACFDGWPMALVFLAPVWASAAGTVPLIASLGGFLPLFASYLVLTVVAFEAVGRGYGRTTRLARLLLNRSRRQDDDHRPTLPLPARARFPDAAATRLMTAEGISASGCRLYGRVPDYLPIGLTVQGEFEIPGGALPFHGRVRALVPSPQGVAGGAEAVEVSFEPEAQDFHDRLDLFLNGSDLPWQLRDLGERLHTASGPARRLFGAGPGDHPETGHWSAAELVLAPLLPASLLSPPLGPAGHRIIASQQRLDGAPCLRLRTCARGGAQELDLEPVRALGRASTPTGDLYLTELAPC